MLNVNDYLLQYKRKLPNILLIWTIILTFIIVFIVIINNTFKLKNYYQLNGIVKDSYLSILMPIYDINSIVNNDIIYIDNIKYSYKIKEIDVEIIQEGTVFYQKIFLDVDLKDKNFIDNNVIKVKFVIKEMTILEYILYLFKGES